jgi:hypothetical protein
VLIKNVAVESNPKVNTPNTGFDFAHFKLRVFATGLQVANMDYFVGRNRRCVGCCQFTGNVAWSRSDAALVKGNDVAGYVKSVGEGVTEFKEGDKASTV